MKEFIKLRRYLHKYPEISGNEILTSKYIKDFISNFKPDEIIEFNNLGLAFVFHGEEPGKTLIFRSELDALPIMENSDIDYISRKNGVSHVCGHDGHMAIIAKLAKMISNTPPKKGKVVLLYQPAEEIGEGALAVINDPKFKMIEPDYIFALHNIPGKDKHKILLKNGTFSVASKGMTIKLIGKTSHAGEPEKGINPVNAITKIISEFNDITKNKYLFSAMTLITIIHIQLGEIAFGTSPGYAEIRATLRTLKNRDMELLTKKGEKIINEIATTAKLKYDISYSEIFPATVNNDECVDLVKNSANNSNLQIEWLEKPFSWSEDFGYYTEKYRCGFFGIGSGVNQPSLHNPNFDFPDDIIEAGVLMFYNIYSNINL